MLVREISKLTLAGIKMSRIAVVSDIFFSFHVCLIRIIDGILTEMLNVKVLYVGLYHRVNSGSKRLMFQSL